MPRFLCKRPLLEQGQEVLLRKAVMIRAGGAVIVIEGDVQSGEGLLHFLVVPVHNGPGRGALLPGAQRDGRPMLIRTADPDDILLA